MSIGVGQETNLGWHFSFLLLLNSCWHVD